MSFRYSEAESLRLINSPLLPKNNSVYNQSLPIIWQDLLEQAQDQKVKNSEIAMTIPATGLAIISLHPFILPATQYGNRCQEFLCSTNKNYSMNIFPIGSLASIFYVNVYFNRLGIQSIFISPVASEEAKRALSHLKNENPHWLSKIKRFSEKYILCGAISIGSAYTYFSVDVTNKKGLPKTAPIWIKITLEGVNKIPYANYIIGPSVWATYSLMHYVIVTDMYYEQSRYLGRFLNTTFRKNNLELAHYYNLVDLRDLHVLTLESAMERILSFIQKGEDVEKLKEVYEYIEKQELTNDDVSKIMQTVMQYGQAKSNKKCYSPRNLLLAAWILFIVFGETLSYLGFVFSTEESSENFLHEKNQSASSWSLGIGLSLPDVDLASIYIALRMSNSIFSMGEQFCYGIYDSWKESNSTWDFFYNGASNIFNSKSWSKLISLPLPFIQNPKSQWFLLGTAIYLTLYSYGPSQMFSIEQFERLFGEHGKEFAEGSYMLFNMIAFSFLYNIFPVAEVNGSITERWNKWCGTTQQKNQIKLKDFLIAAHSLATQIDPEVFLKMLVEIKDQSDLINENSNTDKFDIFFGKTGPTSFFGKNTWDKVIEDINNEHNEIKQSQQKQQGWGSWLNCCFWGQKSNSINKGAQNQKMACCFEC